MTNHERDKARRSAAERLGVPVGALTWNRHGWLVFAKRVTIMSHGEPSVQLVYMPKLHVPNVRQMPQHKPRRRRRRRFGRG